MSTITIYHYEPFYGFYLKKDLYEAPLGIGLPAHSTDIEPPLLICADGFIPVFKKGKWVIEKDDFWKARYETVTYVSGAPLGSYTPISLSSLCGDFPVYPNLPQICNTTLVCILIEQKIRAAQGKYNEAIKCYDDIFKGYDTFQIPISGPKDYIKNFADKPAALYQYHFLVEEMIMYMRGVLDNLVQLTYVLTDFDEYIETMTIKQDKIGRLGTTNNPTTDLELVIIGDNLCYEKDPSKISFLKVINQLSNSIKHSMMHAEAYNQLGESRPTIVSFYADYNNHKKVIMYHQHYLEDMMIGFQCTVLRILRNQKKHIERNSGL